MGPNSPILSIFNSFHSLSLLLIIMSISYSTHCYQLITPDSIERMSEESREVSYINTEAIRANFWAGHSMEEHVAKLNSSNFPEFISQHNESFIMFYANWCSASKESTKQFTQVAQDIAYTEGFTSVHFGALDCNATQANKYICNKTYGIIKYPRFFYFRNGKFDRKYTTWCPRHSDYFYSWIVYGGNDKYCSGPSSAMRFVSSSGSSLSNPTLLSPVSITLAIYILVKFAIFLS